MKINRHDFKLVMTVFIVIIVLFLAQNYTGLGLEKVITLSAAALGGFAILYQLKKDYQISKAEFIYNLNDTFSNNQEIAYIYMKLKCFRDKEDVEFTADDGRRMGDYIMFFYILGYLIDENMINMDMVDRIFSNKFFLFMNNPHVQKHQLIYSEINRPILELYCQWYNYRIKKKRGELYPAHSLTLFNEYIKVNDKKFISLNQDKMHIGYNQTK